jgi:hypothetical protein
VKIAEKSIARLIYRPGASADYRWDDEQPHFGVRLYPSGRRSFVVSYRLKPHRRRYITLGNCTDLSVAQARQFTSDVPAAARQGQEPREALRERRAELAKQGEKVRQAYAAWVKGTRTRLLKPDEVQTG